MVGVAIYPRMSLFNNSCDVNTVKFQRGRQEVLVALLLPCPLGEEYRCGGALSPANPGVAGREV